MQLTHSIALDFGRDTLPITIFAKQYDKESRFVEIVPLECGKDYTLESGVTARLQLTKPDGHTVLKTATIANGVIKVELTEQTLAVAGTAVAEIGLYKGNSLLSSQIFYTALFPKHTARRSKGGNTQAGYRYSNCGAGLRNCGLFRKNRVRARLPGIAACSSCRPGRPRPFHKGAVENKALYPIYGRLYFSTRGQRVFATMQKGNRGAPIRPRLTAQR